MTRKNAVDKKDFFLSKLLTTKKASRQKERFHRKTPVKKQQRKLSKTKNIKLDICIRKKAVYNEKDVCPFNNNLEGCTMMVD